MKILISWIGGNDLEAAEGTKDGPGPIGQALSCEKFDRVILLGNYQPSRLAHYIEWAEQLYSVRPELDHIELAKGEVTDYRKIYEAVSVKIEELEGSRTESDKFTIHLSPGTPAMAAIWVLIARTRFKARLIQTSEFEDGIKDADIPFDISAEFIPEIFDRADETRQAAAGDAPVETSQFGDIIYRSPQMERAVRHAKKVAMRNISVIIEGQSGTGKELFAKAIHNFGPRKDKGIVVVNCGAIPENLVESEFFGHKKGAFTGAIESHAGHFEQANGGTIFLDEIGELPMAAQVKLLRALQNKEVTRVGESKARKIDVRVIAATNRNLMNEVVEGRFREDLYFRLAVATIDLPPLQSREGDVSLLANHILKKVNKEANSEPGYNQKKFSPSARNLLVNHTWPGNVRELENTIWRATLFAEGSQITEADMHDSIRIMPNQSANQDQVLGRKINQDFDIKDIIKIIAQHYIPRALTETGGNKTRAASLLGLGSATSLNDWIKKYEIS